MNANSILHLDLDTFFVSVERLINTELMHRPLLVGGLGDRGVVMKPESLGCIVGCR